jgi:hypothetical protein
MRSLCHQQSATVSEASYTDGGEQVNEKQVTTYTALPQASSCWLVDFKTLPVVC